MRTNLTMEIQGDWLTRVTSVDISFEQTWADLAPIGRDDDSGGYRRYSWSGPDVDLRAWFADQAAARGMTYEVDRNGNQWAWWGPPRPGSLVVGSHLDSVPDGGAFDGPLGVVSAFLAIDELRARGIQPALSIAVLNCSEEEGARFGLACLGSQLMTGAVSAGRARDLVDAEGVALTTALQRAGVDPDGLGRDEEALRRIGTFVELHVEQGRSLIDDNAPVGVASAIWPHGRWRLEFRGQANHAGTTRLVDRNDPMLAFATTVLAVRQAAATWDSVATVGKAQISPNGTNAIPSAVTAWLDARAPDDVSLDGMIEAITAAQADAAALDEVQVSLSRDSYSPAVLFDDALRDRITGVLHDVPVLPTRAGHDAGVLAARVPAAMLFVRNPTGVSHNPVEYAAPEDCVAGIEALADVMADLAG